MDNVKRSWLSLYRYEELYPDDFIRYEKPDFRTDKNTCKWCGRILSNKRRKSYCSDECKWAFEGATVWDRGHSPLPYKILCRDKFICQSCGKFIGLINEHGMKIPTGINAEVHHIKWVSKGGSDRQDNLTSLCLDCHCKVHGKAISKAKEQYGRSVNKYCV